MKTAIHFLRVIATVAIILSCFRVSAQDVWTTGGNNADSTDFIGTINAQPLLIKTDSIDRIIVGVNDSIEFKGAAVFDSIKIPNGFMYADSIRARAIRVGDSSIIIGPFDQFTGTNNVIATDDTGSNSTIGIAPFNGITQFGRNSTGTDVRIGIGRAPSEALDINVDYTNSAIDRTGIAINGITVLHNWGQFNFFAGEDAGSSNNSAIPSGGSQNAFVGYRSGYRNSTGGCNVFMGSGAGGNNTTGINNTFIGNVAGSGNVSDSDNVCVGSEAGRFTGQGSENTQRFAQVFSVGSCACADLGASIG